MLHPQDKQTSGILHQHRVAGMAPPVLISSMPKCQLLATSQQKGAAHKLRTSTMRCEQEQPPTLAHLIHPATASSGQHQAPYLIQNPHTLSCHQSRLEENQVLLIVQDDHVKGGGVPVIGRRLPSKSQNGYLASVQEPAAINEQLLHRSSYQKHIEYAQPIQAYNLEHQVAPVVGRRLHRIQQQQQQQQQLQPVRVQQYDAYTGYHILRDPDTLPINQTVSVMETSHNMKTRKQTVELRQIQCQNVKSNRSSSSSRDKQRSKNQLTTSYHDLEGFNHNIQSCHGYQLPLITSEQQQRYVCSKSRANNTDDIHFIQASRPPVTSSSKLLKSAGLNHSSSYSSLCSTSNEEFFPCCSPVLAKGSRCKEMCCRPQKQATSAPVPPPLRSASCQRVPVCCSEALTVQSMRDKKNRKILNEDQQNVYQYEKQYVHELQTPKSSSSVSSSASSSNTRYSRGILNDSHHDSSCRANHTDQLGVHHSRASSCHDPSRRRQQPQEAPLLISGRNLLPVSCSKISAAFQLTPQSPNNESRKQVKKITLSRTNNNTKLAETQDAEPMTAAVTQMYESLAAELKAKLGDPKMGPILLPPKDYDTLSRKQGKLTGIELRRSTNPQLVGPSSLALRPSCQQVINEDQPLVMSPECPRANSTDRGLLLTSTQLNRQQQGEKCDSARSSARSQDERSLLTRSRSNSSSGLGSISVGEGSQSSSKSSSSEDMRQSMLDNRRGQNKQTVDDFTSNSNFSSSSTRENPLSVKIHQENTNNTTRNSLNSNRKNCSPDNCASSDSGHSEGSPLDSSASSSSEEQAAKLMLQEPTNCIKEDTSRRQRLCDNIGQQNDNRKDQSAKDHMLSHHNNQHESSASRNHIRGRGVIENHNQSKVSDGILWNGRVEVPLKVNNNKNNGNTYLATKQIIY